MDGHGRREKGKNPVRRTGGRIEKRRNPMRGRGDAGISGGPVLKKSSEVEWKIMEPLPDWLINRESTYSNELGLVDTSHALPVHVDGEALKNSNPDSYQALLTFAARCRQKRYLKHFTHPGEDCRLAGGLVSVGPEFLNSGFCREYADLAITQYNRLWQANLKVRKILKLNFLYWAGELCFMTFTAFDEVTGASGTYRASLKSDYALENLPNTNAVGDFVLGLFIDCSTDTILAYLSITGADEDLEEKIKFEQNVVAGVPVGNQF